MNQSGSIDKAHGTRVLLGVLAIWGVPGRVAAETGLYGAVPPLLLAPLIALGIVIPVIVYAMSERFRAYIAAIGLRSITAFHIWGNAAALASIWYGAFMPLPEAFV